MNINGNWFQFNLLHGKHTYYICNRYNRSVFYYSSSSPINLTRFKHIFRCSITFVMLCLVLRFLMWYLWTSAWDKPPKSSTYVFRVCMKAMWGTNTRSRHDEHPAKPLEIWSYLRVLQSYVHRLTGSPKRMRGFAV